MSAYAPVLLERKAEKIRKNLAAQPDSEKGTKVTEVRTRFDGTDRQYVYSPEVLLAALTLRSHLQLENHHFQSSCTAFQTLLL